ncbi:hypothetical protein [Saccharibacillus alkalitolerans]|uniref:Lipoprotein n=1 Tax=Saccharibacillus alkalitolerans TaxID=2705290 RepID=A0ABX0F9P0_9BACL|nr:hypothetical protein [Saccharibacillus alkalitolerans]NGZ77038.1 hypothetical protein [Saccharibacillus alkalitolerans]
MKKILALASITLLTFSVLGCSKQSPSTRDSANETVNGSPMDYAAQAAPNYATMDLAEHFSTLDALTHDSQLIAEVELDGQTEKIAYEGADFLLSSALVTEVISGDAAYLDQNIKILDVESYNIQLTKESNRFILFMDKYEGPVASEEAFVTKGVYQGRYNINANNQVDYNAGEYQGITTFQDDIQKMNVNSFKELIKSSLKSS